MSERYDCAEPTQRASGVAAAVAAVQRGELVVLPTDTVYGIGADAFAPSAVSRLLIAKGRGRDMPVPVLVASRAMLDGVAMHLSADAKAFVDALWPGPLTLVVQHPAHLAWDLGETRGTVAVRMPLHPLALDLIEQTGPLAVSSANVSGRPPATTAADAQEQLGESVAVYLDGGAAGFGVPSTIVDVTGTPPRVLRGGAVGLERLREIVPATAEQ